MRTVRIATYQLPAEVSGQTPSEIKERQADNLLAGLREAGEAGADLACFGETCTTSHVQAAPDDRAIFEDALDGPTTRRVREIAATYKVRVVPTLLGTKASGIV